MNIAKRLLLSNMKETRTINRMTVLSSYTYNNEDVGYIYYNLNTGQISMFYINSYYRNKGLGKQILTNVIHDMEDEMLPEIWCIANKNHLFWSNVFNKSFKYNNYISDNYSGFYLKI